jgi:hypothetical protein
MKALTTTAFLVACTSLALPFAAFGQSADAKYCSALIEKVRKELGGTQASGDVPVRSQSATPAIPPPAFQFLRKP